MLLRTRWAALFHIYQPDNWDRKVIAKVAREAYRPLVRVLKKNRAHRITLNISGSLTEQLARYGFHDVINGFRTLAERGQIEFTNTAKYHPILPLIPEREVIRQLELNVETNRRFFGSSFAPRGVFLPELCYDKVVGRLIARLGYRWIVLDEIAYNGRLGSVDFSKKHWDASTGLFVVFRNRTLSDMFFNLNLKTIYDFSRFIGENLSSRYPLVTALDGENLGHHRGGMDKIYERLVRSRRFATLTLSELLRQLPRKQLTRSPRASSWTSSAQELEKNNPYVLWDDPTNPIHRLQWQVTSGVLKLFDKYSNRVAFCPEARVLVDQALNSDQYWWASAKPWWNPGIIYESLEEWNRVVRCFQGVRRQEIARIQALIRETKKTIMQWERSGTAVERSREYMRKSVGSKLLGGRSVS